MEQKSHHLQVSRFYVFLSLGYYQQEIRIPSHFLSFLCVQSTSQLREHPVFSAQVPSFTRWEKPGETRNLSRKKRMLSGAD